MKTFLILALACITFLANAPRPQTPRFLPLTLMQVIDACAAHYKVPRAVIIGVGLSETGLGTAGVGCSANNLFGIKAYKDWKGERHGKWRKYAIGYGAAIDANSKVGNSIFFFLSLEL